MLTFPLVLTVIYLGNPDLGVIALSYVGSFLMAGTFLSVGSMTSALTRSQIVAFIISFVVIFALSLVDKVLLFVPAFLLAALSFAALGVPTRLGSLPAAEDDRPGGPCTLVIGHSLWIDASTLFDPTEVLSDAEKAERERKRLCDTGIISYAVLSQSFPAHLSGRVNTGINLLVFSFDFSRIWSITVLVGGLLNGRRTLLDRDGGGGKP